MPRKKTKLSAPPRKKTEPSAPPKVESTSSKIVEVVITSIIGLVISATVITAAIPKYKLQIKAPVVKDGVYDGLDGTLIIRWSILRDQWFQEVEINDAKADVTLRTLGGNKETFYKDQPGEIKLELSAGKYEFHINTANYRRSETLEVRLAPQPPPISTATPSQQSKSNLGPRAMKDEDRINKIERDIHYQHSKP